MIDLAPAATQSQLLEAIDERILATGEIMGRYKK